MPRLLSSPSLTLTVNVFMDGWSHCCQGLGGTPAQLCVQPLTPSVRKHSSTTFSFMLLLEALIGTCGLIGTRYQVMRLGYLEDSDSNPLN